MVSSMKDFGHTTRGIPLDTGYRGYNIRTVWVTDHWVFQVFFREEWVDTFLNLEDLKTTIDEWKVAP